MKAILVFSHEHNTFDKRKLLENPHPDFLKESPKTVDMFIRLDDEQPIKKFFMEDIDDLLLKYEPGETKMKPDVLKQMKEIEAERNKMNNGKNTEGLPQIVVERQGGQKSALSAQEIVQLLSSQQEQLKALSARNAQLEAMVKDLQNKLINGSSPEIPTVLFRELTQGTYGSPNPSLNEGVN
jgi:cell division protein FtsB